REERLLHERPDTGVRATEVVAVVAGAGNARLFRSLGAAQIVDGGRTMNPSAEDIVAAIEGTSGGETLVIPNNALVILSARRAAALPAAPRGRIADGHAAGRLDNGPMADPIRLVLVEDNVVFREALELLLGLRGDLEIVASVGDGGEAVRACTDLAPDVVLMD